MIGDPWQDAWDQAEAAAGRGTLGSVLDDVEAFLAQFVAYPSDAARVAHVLWIVHTHLMDCWESTPRIAFLSPELGSGKTRALEVSEPLVPRPIHAVNATPAYLFRKVSDPDGAPTVLYDEIDTIFGQKAKDNEDIRGMLNAGHRKGAMAGRCVVRGKIIETEELPAYCAVALAGLEDLPDTLRSRAVVIRMRKRSPAEKIKPWRLRTYRDEAAALYQRIRSLANQIKPHVNGAWPVMPDGVADRNADVWEALLAIADAVGGRWPERSRAAAVFLVREQSKQPPSLGVTLLRDLKLIFGDHRQLATEEILAALVKLEESPWANLRGKPLDARGLASRLGKYDVRSVQVWTADRRNAHGYKAEALFDPWMRYLPAADNDVGDPAYRGARSARTASEADDTDSDLADLADLASPMPGTPMSDPGPGSAGSAGSAGSFEGGSDIRSVNGSPGSNGHAGGCRYCGQPVPGSTDGFCDAVDAGHMQARKFAGPGIPTHERTPR